MGYSRSLLLGGPGYGTYNSKKIQFLGDCKVEKLLETQVLSSALRGPIDELDVDRMIKVTAQPMFYDTAQLADMFPYIGGISPGGIFPPGGSDKTFAISSTNTDVITLTSALVTKMPDLTLGVDGAVLGSMEWTGVVADGGDPSDDNSYYTESTASYVAPTVPVTAVIGRQQFTATWGDLDGFDSFTAQDKFTIQHQLQLQAWKQMGQTIAYKFLGYTVGVKCRPLGPTKAQIDAQLALQGTGAGGGNLRSTISANLVITGTNSITVTVGSAYLKTMGLDFAGAPLRIGEVMWVSSIPGADTNGGATTAPLALA